MTYDDSRLAAIYDADNPDGADHDFFRAMADNINPQQIVDLGCGTGLLTVTLARPGRQVIGIDPAQAMLDYARARPGGNTVEWRRGTAARINTDSADLIIMSSNVAMHILQTDWPAALTDIARGLSAGGTLCFDTRHPAVQARREWNQDLTERDTVLGRLRESTRTTPPDSDGVVTMHCHNDFVDQGGVLDVDQQLQFRTLIELTADLKAAGLAIQAVWSDWQRTPFTGATGATGDKLLVIEASR